jgi:hypothetical protein
MRIAAGIVAILMGTGNLMVVALYGGMIGSAAVWFGSLGPGNPSLSDWGSVVQFLSWMAPLLTIAGGIITFSHPRIGGVILGVAASAVWYRNRSDPPRQRLRKQGIA